MSNIYRKEERNGMHHVIHTTGGGDDDTSRALGATKNCIRVAEGIRSASKQFPAHELGRGHRQRCQSPSSDAVGNLPMIEDTARAWMVLSDFRQYPPGWINTTVTIPT